MTQILAYALQHPQDQLVPFELTLRKLKEQDILIDILYCGICHSDIHQARSEWGQARYPMVPGHEIVGRVKQIGAKVIGFAIGDAVGVGCMVDSCRECGSCQDELQQFCSQGPSFTYNSLEQDKQTPTYGGYAKGIVVHEDFVLKIAPQLDLARVAPLLCAGITTYSPLRRWNVGPGQKVGIIGLGGLGHMGVKIATAMGAEVSVFTTSLNKYEDAKALGAKHVILSKDEAAMKAAAKQFDLILDTVSAKHDINLYLATLKRDGVMVSLGIPPEPVELSLRSLLSPPRILTGSSIGGIKETQEMLDFCAQHRILSDIEIIAIQDVNLAYERLLKGDVKYRFVIDMQSLQG